MAPKSKTWVMRRQRDEGEQHGEEENRRAVGLELRAVEEGAHPRRGVVADGEHEVEPHEERQRLDDFSQTLRRLQDQAARL